jgi:hypothetical protein
VAAHEGDRTLHTVEFGKRRLQFAMQQITSVRYTLKRNAEASVLDRRGVRLCKVVATLLLEYVFHMSSSAISDFPK